jgi:hypothetical protein
MHTGTRKKEMSESYQGWTNHATWCVALHIGNTECLFNEACAIAQKRTEHAWQRDDALRDYVTGMITELTRPNEIPEHVWLLMSDLISGYLADVNWKEIRISLQQRG